MHDRGISEYDCFVCQRFPRTFEDHEASAPTPKGFSFLALFIALCSGVALGITGLAIFLTSRAPSPAGHDIVARLAPLSAPNPSEHFYDASSTLVVPDRRSAAPSSKKTAAVTPRISIPSAVGPEDSHDVSSKTVVSHLIDSNRNAAAIASRDSESQYIFLPPSHLQPASPTAIDVPDRASAGTSSKKVATAEAPRPTPPAVPAAHPQDTQTRPAIAHLSGLNANAAEERVAMAPRDSASWHIFLPPSDLHGKSPNPSAPFKRWMQGESYANAEDCENYREHQVAEAAADRDHGDSPADALAYRIELFTYAECISAQDPRVNGLSHAQNRAELARSDGPGDGWYIFLPPGDARHQNPIQGAPFRRWVQDEAFDTVDDCQDYRERQVSEAVADRDQTEGPTDALDYKIKLFTEAECISAQDPRLNQNTPTLLSKGHHVPPA
jgi:hypothetical protein